MQRQSHGFLSAILFKVGMIVVVAYSGAQLFLDVGPSARHGLKSLESPGLGKPYQSRKPGPRVIFRLDDVEAGVREAQVFDILAVFKRHEAPVDVGIIPRANGRDSYALHWLRPYVDNGSVDIDVHGITHEVDEFDTSKSGNSRESLATGLRDATNRLTGFYGVRPVAFLVPYDVFDEPGYRAVRDAGFRIFSSQWQTDRHRGTAPIDFDSRVDEQGLYRLPAVDDAVSWDASRRSWGGFQPMSDLLFSMRASLERLGVAVISLHPAAFQQNDGATDPAKLVKLGELLEEARKLGQISTFRNWYCTYPADEEAGIALRFCG